MIAIGIDQGTTGTRAIAYDEHLRPVTQAYRRVDVTHPRPGWISKDASAVVDSIGAVLGEVVAAVGGARRVAAVGLDNEGETLVAWDRATLEPLADAVVWGCRRSQPVVDRLVGTAAGALVEARSGLPLDPYFSASKARFLIESDPAVGAAARAGRACFGTLDAYVCARLAGGARTEPSTAARTQLQALAAPGRWDDELLAAFELDGGSLPPIGDSAGDLGTLAVPGVGKLPLRALLVDQTAALAGHGCLDRGAVKATYGTGIFVLQHAGGDPPGDTCGLLPTIAWALPEGTSYALDGGVLSAGTVVDWLCDGVGLAPDPKATEALARSVQDTGGVAFLPALAGVGAPWWRAESRAVIAGITAGTGRGQIVRAALDSLCFRVRDIVEAMGKAGAPPALLPIDGGLTANGYLVQRQADVLGIPVRVADTSDATARGSAAIALVGAGLASLPALAPLLAGGRRVEPRAAADAEYARWRAFADAASRL